MHSCLSATHASQSLHELRLFILIPARALQNGHLDPSFDACQKAGEANLRSSGPPWLMSKPLGVIKHKTRMFAPRATLLAHFRRASFSEAYSASYRQARKASGVTTRFLRVVAKGIALIHVCLLSFASPSFRCMHVFSLWVTVLRECRDLSNRRGSMTGLGTAACYCRGAIRKLSSF